MPRFLTTALVQEGESLTLARREARLKVRTRAHDKADEALLIEMLGLDEQDEDESHAPLDAGFDDRAIAARRRRAFATDGIKQAKR